MKKIKKINYIIPLLLLVFFFESCDLDVVPENALTYTNSFLTENELNATTSSIHFFMNSAMKPTYIFSNVGVFYDYSRYGMSVAEWSPNAVVKSMNFWDPLYDVIYEGNLLLDNIHLTEGLTEDRYNFHAGQARFAIGLAYFELVRQYGDCVVTKDSKTIEMYGTSPMLEVIDVAIGHAEKAYEILPVAEDLRGINNQALFSKQFASKGASVALLAHLYAWKGSVIDLYRLNGDSKEAYTKSVEYATILIDGKAGDYQLCNSAEELCFYLSNQGKEDPETIFSLTFDVGRSLYTVTPNSIASSFAGWPVNRTQTMGDIVYMTDRIIYKSTIDDLYADENDERKQAFFYEVDEEHVIDGTDYAIPYKFREGLHEEDSWSPSGYDFRSIDADYVYWRLADIILLRAECNAKLNNTGEAIADLNQIRSRANATLYPSVYDNDDLQRTIFKERDKEFILESGHRYFDILRNNYIKTELRGKFKELTNSEIMKGALVLPIPSGAYQDSNGSVINTLIRQKEYWMPYL